MAIATNMKHILKWHPDTKKYSVRYATFEEAQRIASASKCIQAALDLIKEIEKTADKEYRGDVGLCIDCDYYITVSRSNVRVSEAIDATADLVKWDLKCIISMDL